MDDRVISGFIKIATFDGIRSSPRRPSGKIIPYSEWLQGDPFKQFEDDCVQIT